MFPSRKIKSIATATALFVAAMGCAHAQFQDRIRASLVLSNQHSLGIALTRADQKNIGADMMGLVDADLQRVRATTKN
jgi:hypothetical protein